MHDRGPIPGEPRKGPAPRKRSKARMGYPSVPYVQMQGYLRYSSIKSMFTSRWNTSCNEMLVSVVAIP